MTMSLAILMCTTMVTAMMATANVQSGPVNENMRCDSYQACGVKDGDTWNYMCLCNGADLCPLYDDSHGIEEFVYFCETVDDAPRCTDLDDVAIKILPDYYGQLCCRCRTYTWREGSDHVYCEELLEGYQFLIRKLSLK
uniref:Gsp_19 putative toxin n=1 Tax=Gemmula speciosa TaxID=439592 RepID=A0A098LXT9_GEMSP